MTTFKTSVEVEARERAVAAIHYRRNRAALAETASRIWRDPAGAVDMIEDLIQKGIAGERIAAAIANDPAAYGALRGSGRIMDKLLATGRERKAALQAVSEVGGCVRSLGSSWTRALDVETRTIREERERMAVAIPGLSSTADGALRKITEVMKKKGVRLEDVTGSLQPHIVQEFATVSKALDLRFGRNAILRGEKDLINRLSSAQRPAFEALQGKLKIVQQTVRNHQSQQIVAERRQRSLSRALDRGHDIKH